MNHLRWFSIICLLVSLFLPLYSTHQVFVDATNIPYLDVYSDVSLLGEAIRFKFSHSNLTNAGFYFVGTDFIQAPFSPFTFFRFIAFLLAILSLFLVLNFQFLSPKPKLLDYSFRLMLDSMILIWAPVILFNFLKYPNYQNCSLVSVLPSYGFFVYSLALIFTYFYYRNVRKGIFGADKAKRRWKYLKKLFAPSYSTRTPKLSSRLIVTLILSTLIFGMIFTNFVLSAGAVHNLRIHGIPFYKGIYKTYSDTPDITFDFDEKHLKMYFMGGVSNPSQIFIVLKNIKVQIYLNNVSFGEYTFTFNKLLYPQEVSPLNFEILIKTENLSQQQLNILNKKSSPIPITCIIEADSQSLPFFFEWKDKFCFYGKSWVT